MEQPNKLQIDATLAVVEEGVRALKRGSFKGADATHIARFFLWADDFEKSLKDASKNIKAEPIGAK